MTPERQRRTLDFLQSMNEMDTLDTDTEMAARSVPTNWRSVCRVTRRKRWISPRRLRPPERLYGLDQKHTSEFGTRCLLARRLVERGVRFVQLYSGGGPVSMQWDAHSNLVENHEKMCAHDGSADRRFAARFEAARAARSDAGDLGRGVRSIADVAGRQWTGSQSARIHDVVRGRRR